MELCVCYALQSACGGSVPFTTTLVHQINYLNIA